LSKLNLVSYRMRLVAIVVTDSPSIRGCRCGESLIITDDFNDWRGRAGRHLTAELGVSEVFMKTRGKYARSFPVWMPVLTMDRSYSRGLHLTRCQQLQGQPWRKLSGHIPLMAEFALA
jgi:endonuclease/exonuclease/phosphatase family metal-dependent hydrolase